jgi:hypothetical protein
VNVKDYLKEDNDTVSIFINREPWVKNFNIEKKPLKLSFDLHQNFDLVEIIVYANNLGLIPPNTCKLEVNDGERTQTILIESTLQKSAVLYLRKIPKEKAR